VAFSSGAASGGGSSAPVWSGGTTIDCVGTALGAGDGAPKTGAAAIEKPAINTSNTRRNAAPPVRLRPIFARNPQTSRPHTSLCDRIAANYGRNDMGENRCG
jgi:hypothetical protein